MKNSIGLHWDESEVWGMKLLHNLWKWWKSFMLFAKVLFLPFFHHRGGLGVAHFVGVRKCAGVKFFISTWQIRYHLFLIIVVVIITFLLLWDRENTSITQCTYVLLILIIWYLIRWHFLQLIFSFTINSSLFTPVIPSQWTKSAKCFVIPSVVRNSGEHIVFVV